MSLDPSLLNSLRYGAMVPTDGLPRVVKDRMVSAHALPETMAHVEPWFRFDFRAGLDETGHPTRNRSGWKVHLSVASECVGTAWDAVLPLVAGEALLAKVASPSLNATIDDPDARQAGKSLVIYADGVRRAGTQSFWRRFLPSVEDALRKARVRPGWAIRGSRPVPNSRYVHVRDDRDPQGRYVSGIDAYDPFGSPSPFDGVKVDSRHDCPEPIGRERDRIARMLDFVSPGWEPTDEGYCLLAEDETDAKAIRRALGYVDIVATVRGEALSVASLDDRRVAARWHQAMEIRRAAALGRLVKDATGREARVSVRPRDAGALPPQVRVAFVDPLAARHALPGLGPLADSGSPPPYVEGTALVIPYAGRLHDERVGDRMSRLAEDVARAVRDAPRGDLETVPAGGSDLSDLPPSPSAFAWS